MSVIWNSIKRLAGLLCVSSCVLVTVFTVPGTSWALWTWLKSKHHIQSVISYVNCRMNGLWFCSVSKQGPWVLWAMTVACFRLFNPPATFLDLLAASLKSSLELGWEEGAASLESTDRTTLFLLMLSAAQSVPAFCTEFQIFYGISAWTWLKWFLLKQNYRFTVPVGNIAQTVNNNLGKDKDKTMTNSAGQAENKLFLGAKKYWFRRRKREVKTYSM